MQFLGPEHLYTSVDDCLAHMRRRPLPPPPGPWRAHLYWRGPFGRKQAFAIKSFLATQRRGEARLWLWLDAGSGFTRHEQNAWLRPLLPLIDVRPFDAAAETAGTPLDSRALYHALNNVHRSNLVRLAVLHRYGGVYADMDTMFLRDFGALLADPQIGRAFAYRWSAHMPCANSAVMALEAGSRLGERLLARAAERGSCRPRDLLRFEDNADLDLLVLPCAWFDPLWPIRDGRDTASRAPFRSFEGFFRPAVSHGAADPDLSTFFPGAFAYHWHNGWHEPERPDSWFAAFERAFDRRLAEVYGVAASAAR